MQVHALPMYKQTHKHSRTHVYTHIHSHIYTYIHVNMHALIRTCTHTYIHTHKNIFVQEALLSPLSTATCAFSSCFLHTEHQIFEPYQSTNRCPLSPSRACSRSRSRFLNTTDKSPHSSADSCVRDRAHGTRLLFGVGDLLGNRRARGRPRLHTTRTQQIGTSKNENIKRTPKTTMSNTAEGHTCTPHTVKRES